MSSSSSPTPAELGFAMPAEWARHERTWMAWPTEGYTLGEDPAEAYRAWSQVANTIVRYEPVTMVLDPSPAARASADEWLDPAVRRLERPLNDAWMRDIGPTFLTRRGSSGSGGSADGSTDTGSGGSGSGADDGAGSGSGDGGTGGGGLAVADWVFNGWGAQEWAQWDKDAEIAEAVAAESGARRFVSRMVNEGGGIHVDGEGTVLITETVQLDPGRNPGWTKAEVEREFEAFLGARKVIWLPRGLTRDYGEFGTRGHVDIVAAFVRPGVVLVHTQPDPAHPDHEVGRENVSLLRAQTDARGRSLQVVELPAPTILTEADGEPVDYSYINHYLGNGFVLLCAFDDPRDRQAAETLAALLPDRKVELVDARPIFERGGGIHCITQQQPAV